MDDEARDAICPTEYVVLLLLTTTTLLIYFTHERPRLGRLSMFWIYLDLWLAVSFFGSAGKRKHPPRDSIQVK